MHARGYLGVFFQRRHEENPISRDGVALFWNCRVYTMLSFSPLASPVKTFGVVGHFRTVDTGRELMVSAKRREEQRVKEINALEFVLRELPVLVGGDFNDVPSSPVCGVTKRGSAPRTRTPQNPGPPGRNVRRKSSASSTTSGRPRHTLPGVHQGANPQCPLSQRPHPTACRLSVSIKSVKCVHALLSNAITRSATSGSTRNLQLPPKKVCFSMVCSMTEGTVIQS